MSREPDATRDRLLAAAVAEFAAHGFQQATVRDICGRAEANLNAVKYYFDDKQGLYAASVQRAYEVLHRQGFAQGPPAGDAEARLRWFIENMLATVISSPEESLHHQLLMREMADPQPGGTEEVVRTYIRPRFGLLQAIIAELLPADASHERIRLLSFSVIGQCMHYKVAMPVIRMLTPPAELAGYTPQRLAEHITAVTLAAAREPAPDRPRQSR